MSNALFIKKVANSQVPLDFQVLKQTMSSVEANHIKNATWKEQFPYIPQVFFKIAHSDDKIVLYYHVEEEFVKAQAIRPNESVWEDSCVELFLSLDNKQTYYNFEFNVLGTGLIGYGPSVKSERNRLTAEQIQSVETLTLVGNKGGQKVWEMFLLIPKDLVGEEGLSGKTAHANFYKCGDKLPNPHFISWNPIDFPSPNFHLPQFFGEVNFE